MATSPLNTAVSEMTTCTICFKDLNSPTALPCLHTFCLGCLQGHCWDKRPGSKAECPMCKAEFMIPRYGPCGFPVYFSMQPLIEAKHASRRDPCEVCSTDQQFVPATVLDCSQKLCERCSLPHKKMPRGPHDVRPLAAEQDTGIPFIVLCVAYTIFMSPLMRHIFVCFMARSAFFLGGGVSALAPYTGV